MNLEASASSKSFASLECVAANLDDHTDTCSAMSGRATNVLNCQTQFEASS